jgi:hypothetical protein
MQRVSMPCKSMVSDAEVSAITLVERTQSQPKIRGGGVELLGYFPMVKVRVSRFATSVEQ